MTDEQYQWVAECGFNYAIPIYEGTFENNLKAMDMLSKYGVQYFPQDQSLVSLARQSPAIISDATVMSYPSSLGIPLVFPPSPSTTLRS